MAKHMTQDDRKTLEARYNAGQSVAGIARAMRFNYSTIYKELKRGDTGKMDANGRAGYSAANHRQHEPRGNSIHRPGGYPCRTAVL